MVHQACEAVFDTPEDVRFCKDKCPRCRVAGTAFCIHEPDAEHSNNHATCCPRGQVCCGSGSISCCAPEWCCDLGTAQGCLQPGQNCCEHDADGFCEPGDACCAGIGCIDPEVATEECGGSFVFNPETCECECPEGSTDCDGECIAGAECPDEACGGTCSGDGMHCCPTSIGPRCFNTNAHPIHCGGCDQECLGDFKYCCDGECVDTQFNNAYCGPCTPCGPGTECCHGGCIDPRVVTCCRDHPYNPNRPMWCASGLVCCTNDNGAPSCCSP